MEVCPPQIQDEQEKKHIPLLPEGMVERLYGDLKDYHRKISEGFGIPPALIQRLKDDLTPLENTLAGMEKYLESRGYNLIKLNEKQQQIHIENERDKTIRETLVSGANLKMCLQSIVAAHPTIDATDPDHRKGPQQGRSNDAIE